MIGTILTCSTPELYLAGITVILFMIQLLYLLIVYARPLRAAKHARCESAENAAKPVSVIVYARGEAEDLRRNLPHILNQEYPDFEVIVVNDGSDAESEDVLKLFSNEYKHLYYTYVPTDTQYLSHKKLALTMGIKAAKHDILLFTEANCRPHSNKWITSMTGTYTKSTDIILGYCSYGNYPGFFQKLVAYDNLINGLRYIASALSRSPYSGNGQNLSYRKEVFFAHKGYSKSLNLHAGADDLFINETSNPVNTQVVYSPNSLMEADQTEDFLTYKLMKVSRAATEQYYRGSSLLFYRTETCSFLLFLAASLIAIVVGLLGNWLLSALAGFLWVLRFAIRAVILRKSAILLQQKPLTGWLCILELVQPAFNFYIRIYRIFRGKKDYTSKI